MLPREALPPCRSMNAKSCDAIEQELLLDQL